MFATNNQQENPTFKNPHNNIDLFSQEHKQIVHKNVATKLCKFKGCTKQPTFGDPKDRIALFCIEHKENHHKDVKNRMCDYQGCEKRANFGDPNNRTILFCAYHKENDHINLKSKLCGYKGCKKLPRFGDRIDKIALFCVDHKEDEHVNVIDKKCDHAGCQKQPTFGNRDDKVPLFCLDHKTNDHVDVRHKFCNYPNCEKRPNFGNRIDKIAQFCIDHKDDDHIDVKHKLCAQLNCPKRANFGNKNDKIALFCIEHKDNNHVDVTHKLCEYINCPSRPLFGFPGYPLSHCSRHKEDGQIKRSKSKCQEKGCHEWATHGISFPIKCESHKLENHKDLVNRICTSCKLPNILNQQNLCEYCNPEIFKKIRLRKQNKVKEFLDLNLPEDCKYISTDIIIDKGQCGKERPDFLFEFKTFMLVLEVDENQHKDRNCECEITRMINIYYSLGMKTLFIRYNPDKYKINPNYKYVKGLERRNNLLKQILYWKRISESMLQNPNLTIPECSVIYMYFDNDDPVHWNQPNNLNIL